MQFKTGAGLFGCLYVVVWLLAAAASLAIPTLIVLALIKYIKS